MICCIDRDEFLFSYALRYLGTHRGVHVGSLVAYKRQLALKQQLGELP